MGNAQRRVILEGVPFYCLIGLLLNMLAMSLFACRIGGGDNHASSNRADDSADYRTDGGHGRTQRRSDERTCRRAGNSADRSTLFGFCRRILSRIGFSCSSCSSHSC